MTQNAPFSLAVDLRHQLDMSRRHHLGQRRAFELAQAIHHSPAQVLRVLNRHLGFSDEVTRITHKSNTDAHGY